MVYDVLTKVCAVKRSLHVLEKKVHALKDVSLTFTKWLTLHKICSIDNTKGSCLEIKWFMVQKVFS
jgi:hypothetical protein